MRVFLRTKKKKLFRFSHPKPFWSCWSNWGYSKGTWVFFNTFSKAIQPRFYELRKIGTWLWHGFFCSDFKKMFRWNVSQACDFPILLEQQILFGTTKSIQKKTISPSTSKRTQFPPKKLHPKFHCCFCSSFWDSWSTVCSSKYMLLPQLLNPPGVRHPEIGHSDPESAAEHHRHHGLHIGLDLGTRLLLPRGASDFREGKRGRFPKTMGVMNQTTMTQRWGFVVGVVGVLKKKTPRLWFLGGRKWWLCKKSWRNSGQTWCPVTFSGLLRVRCE